ncbi:LysR family transcriptional regulator [Lysobacter enzymogenes]|nr:LysR family transcriptional regulator [Lysobacter enzymogenes]
MQHIDLNLLTALDALLDERSVTAAARRLGLSPSAMSRTLSRLRAATGDALLVQAGRALVPTPYAQALAERVHRVASDARDVLQPGGQALDLSTLERTFAIRANDALVDRIGPSLVAAIVRAAPRVRIRFVPKLTKDAEPLREGTIDLEVGVLGTQAPEMKTRLAFKDRFVGICRAGHPLAPKRSATAKRYVAYPHVVVSRHPPYTGPVDAALEKLGLRRSILMAVPTYANAMRIVAHSDLIGLVPHSSLRGAAGQGLQSFELPVATREIQVSLIWHPRFQADAAHRWLRDTVWGLCQQLSPTAR